MGKARSSGPLSLDGRNAEDTSSFTADCAEKWPTTRKADETLKRPEI